MDRAALKALIDQKDAMEKEIFDLNEALSANNLGGVSTPVIDAEGFPRADVDVHTTLTLRNRLARLNTDHREIMSRIEAGLMGVLPAQPRMQPTGGGSAPFAAAAAAPAPPPEPPVVDTGTTQPAPVPSTGPIPMEVIDVSEALGAEAAATLEPFAEIDEDGPAAAAGVLVGDVLIKFGSVHCRNHDGLRALARLTQRSVGEAIGLVVLRAASSGGAEGGAKEHVRLELRPRRWAGNGLLGCHLKPL